MYLIDQVKKWQPCQLAKSEEERNIDREAKDIDEIYFIQIEFDINDFFKLNDLEKKNTGTN